MTRYLLPIRPLCSAVIALACVAYARDSSAQNPRDTHSLGSARPLDLGELGVPGGVASSPDGVFVIDRDGRRVIAFDSRGLRRWISGCSGSGPGEYRSPSGVWVVGDTVYIFDASLRRLTLLDGRGRFQRSVAIAGHPDARGAPTVVAIGRDGSAIARWFVSVRRGHTRDTTVLTRHAADGSPAGSLGRWAADERLVAVVGSDYQVLSPPFAATLSVAACGGTTFIASGDRPLLARLSADGRPMPSINLSFLPRPVSAAQLRTHDEAWINRTADDARTPALETSIRGLRDLLDSERATAVVGRLLVDPTCRVWVSHPDSGDSVRWWRVTDDGRVAATFVAPRSVRVLAIGTEWVVLEHTDEDGLRSLSLTALVPNR